MRCAFGLLLLSLLATALPVHAEVGRYTIVVTGHAAVPAGEREVELRIACSTGGRLPNEVALHGHLALELEVPDPDHTGFDVEPFEGPDAPAAAKALSALQVGNAGRSSKVELPAAGWFGAPHAAREVVQTDVPPFVFSIAQPSQQQGRLSQLVRRLAALSGNDARLRWIQRGDGAASAAEIEATFSLDAAQQQALRHLVEKCLPNTPPR
jgi:hypothetical protein